MMGLSGRKKEKICVVCLNKVWPYTYLSFVSLSCCDYKRRMTGLLGEGSTWNPAISQSVVQRALESDMQVLKKIPAADLQPASSSCLISEAGFPHL